MGREPRKRKYTLPAAAGAAQLDGALVDLARTQTSADTLTLTAESGRSVLIGGAAGFTSSRWYDEGRYGLNGARLALVASRPVTAARYAMTGAPALVNRSGRGRYVVSAVTGHYQLSGSPVAYERASAPFTVGRHTLTGMNAMLSHHLARERSAA